MSDPQTRPPFRFFSEFPTSHRTDWGEDFFRRLDAAFADIGPLRVDENSRKVVAGSGGALVVLLRHREIAEAIQMQAWEDGLCIWYGPTQRGFGPDTHPPNAEEPWSWIPTAVDFSLALVRGQVKVEAYFDYRLRVRRATTYVERDGDFRLVSEARFRRLSRSRHPDFWTFRPSVWRGPSYLAAPPVDS